MSTTVTIAQGALRGTEADGVFSFKGISYAAPPFGDLRFAAPVPPAGWDGVRDASEYGPTVPKNPYRESVRDLLPEPDLPGEDCLNLNVWTPDPRGSRPVLVWIHGGAFINGSGAVPAYDGSAFARDGVVCVTINYRLGADGFALLPDRPVNRGLLDQVAALEWVRDNISAFGGDPGRVTVAGESAGGMSVGCLLAMPAAKGLFTGAIAQSGAGHHAVSPEAAALVAEAVGQALGVEPTGAALAQVPLADLLAAQLTVAARVAAEPAKFGEAGPVALPFAPVIDGNTLPELPVEAVRRGSGAGVRLLAGSNDDEMTLFLSAAGITERIVEPMVAPALGALGVDGPATAALYRELLPEVIPGEVLVAAMTDWVFRVPASRLAEAVAQSGGHSWVYQFGWASPAQDGRLRACHALEIGFAFDNLTDSTGQAMAGAQPPQDLADQMHAAWVAFVTDGDPGWAEYLPDRAVRYFADAPVVLIDPDPERRVIWEAVR